MLKLLPYKIITLIKRLPNMKYLTNVYFFLFTVFIASVHADLGWRSPPFDLSASNRESNRPQICCDSSGNAFAIWNSRQIIPPSLFSIIQVAYFNGDTLTWSTPFNLTEGPQTALDPQICCDEFGNAFAIWIESDQIVMSSRFDKNTMIWSTPIQLEDNIESYEARICCDNFGNATAIWVASNGTNLVVQAAYFNGSSWTPTGSGTTISNPGEDTDVPQICCDDLGNTIAVWQSYNGFNTIIQSSRFDGSSWTPAEQISKAGLDAFRPQICCNNSGNAIAVWAGSDGSNLITQASLFDGTSWSSSEDIFDISLPGENTFQPQVCCDSSGNAFATWRRSNGANDIIQASMFNGTSWTALADIPNLSEAGEDAEDPQICCDDLGNAYVVWQRSNGTNTVVQTSQFDGISWSSPPDHPATPGVPSFSPQVCCDNSGKAISVWVSAPVSGIEVIQSSFYTPMIFPPANFQGNRVTNQFPSQSSTSAHLSWTPNTDPNVTSFLIFKDGILLTTIPSYLSSYKDCNIDPCQSYSYTIISVNVTGDESAVETITL